MQQRYLTIGLVVLVVVLIAILAFVVSSSGNQAGAGTAAKGCYDAFGSPVSCVQRREYNAGPNLGGLFSGNNASRGFDLPGTLGSVLSCVVLLVILWLLLAAFITFTSGHGCGYGLTFPLLVLRGIRGAFGARSLGDSFKDHGVDFDWVPKGEQKKKD